MRVTLTNGYHDTEVTLDADVQPETGEALLSESQVKRARRELCGMSDCECGRDEASAKPAQIEPAYKGYWRIIPRERG